VWSTFPDPKPITFPAAVMLGLLAVPVAPIAKDTVSLLTNLRNAMKKKQPGS
jgi:hypothetical protein